MIVIKEFEALNRTILELKYSWCRNKSARYTSLNRTILELKFKNGCD